jgi:hypothetical protein
MRLTGHLVCFSMPFVSHTMHDYPKTRVSPACHNQPEAITFDVPGIGAHV